MMPILLLLSFFVIGTLLHNYSIIMISVCQTAPVLVEFQTRNTYPDPNTQSKHTFSDTALISHHVPTC